MSARSGAFLAVVATVVLTPSASLGQRLDIGMGLELRSGLSLGPGEGEAVARRTPAAMEVEAAFVLDGDARWEYVADLALQVEGTPAFGLAPMVRRVQAVPPWAYYGALGGRVWVAPFTLAGPVFGAGIRRSLTPGGGLEAFVEVLAEVGLVGNDLNKDGSLVMLNPGGGVRLAF